MKTITLIDNSTIILKRKRTEIRDIFGIIPITLYTKNFKCSISCVYCPQVNNFPKSYLNNEDTERALKLNYDPLLQINYWKEELNKKFGLNKPLKLEIIILGGTFGDLPNDYREDFFKRMYDGLNGTISKNIEEAIQLNKNAIIRACIVNIETRPDKISFNECSFLRKLGVSKIELGIQSIYDDVLKFSGRPYNYDNILEVTKLIKNQGFKLGYHIMLNLPKSNLELDTNMLHEITINPNIQPDFIKIYPLTLIKEKESQKRMWEFFEKGIWTPYNTEQLLYLIYNFKLSIPNYIKIQRIQRQFDDSDYLYEDIEIRNLLQMMLRDNKKECNCLRCQEIKTFKSKLHLNSDADIVFNVTKVDEFNFFIDLKSKKDISILLGYLKLNLNEVAIVREIKIIGKTSKIGLVGQIQGNGLGENLLNFTEKLAHSLGYKELLINASPGVRGFFEKNNYFEKDHFLTKFFNE